MVLLSMPHFMKQDNGNFIRIARHGIKPCIDAHDMAHTAERIERFIIIDEIKIRFLMDSRIYSPNGAGQLPHHVRKLTI